MALIPPERWSSWSDRRKQAHAWFSRIELPPRSRSTADHTPQLAVA
jgi:hypothetical protein